MRLAPFALAVLVLPILAVGSGCQRHEEAPAPPPAAAPVSIWSEADSQAVAAQLVEAAAAHAWSSQFRDRNGRAATIAIGTITDRSGKDIPVDGLAAEVAAAITAAGGDKLATGGESSDFILGGVVGASAGTIGDGQPATYFAIDLSLTDRATGDVVWHFAVERPIADR